MSHCIEHYDYPETCNKDMIEADLNNHAACADFMEGCVGLSQRIRWIDHICEDYEAAEKYIQEHDSGEYDQLAVKYYESSRPAQLKTTKKVAEMQARRQRLWDNYKEKQDKIHYKGVKSEYISCKCCGSRLATKYIKSNKCPLCGSDLRPASTIEAIEKAKAAYVKADKDLSAELRKQQKNAKPPKVRWLVKIEYHT